MKVLPPAAEYSEGKENAYVTQNHHYRKTVRSGGSEIGRLTAEALGIPFYDRELIEMASEKMGIDSFELERIDETAISRFRLLRPDPSASIHSVIGYGLPLNDNMHATQNAIIEKLAEQGPCVFIGRCADVVLRDRYDCVNVFICAPKAQRIARMQSVIPFLNGRLLKRSARWTADADTIMKPTPTAIGVPLILTRFF